MGNCQGSKINGPNVIRLKHAGKEIKKHYRINNKPIGSGAFAKVYKGEAFDDWDTKVAVKIINKLWLGEEDLKAIGDEIVALQTLDHPNIVKYVESFEDSRFMFIVTKFCEGTTLGHQIKNQRTFSEHETAIILKQLTSAIEYCHSLKVSHRDIKPDNIMIDSGLNVVLIDFGLSKLNSKNRFKSVIGSPLYMSPEVYNGKYNNKCDIWSLGVLAYHLISGRHPFMGDTVEEVQKNAQTGTLEFSEEIWETVSPSWKDLLECMIVVDSKSRYSATEVLKHPWLNSLNDTCDDGVTMASSKNVLSSIQNLNQEWKVDKSKDGTISFDDLKNELNLANIHMSDGKIKKVISQLKFSTLTDINFNEFMTFVKGKPDQGPNSSKTERKRRVVRKN